MSGIVGLFNRDGAPVEQHILRSMLEGIRHRGPHGTNTWTDGAVGLGHAMLHTTPESLFEKLPLSRDGNRWAVTAHARVDNRSELARLLDLTAPECAAMTDSALLLSSYQKWGPELGSKVIGDFAVVIWDREARTLFCVRDTAGAKPLYYYLDEKLFLFASEPAVLLRHPRVAAVPNEGMVGEYLSVMIGSRDETLWEGIMRLPPGESLLVQPTLSQRRTYWRAGPRSILRYGSDAEYADHFRSLLDDAVRVRLRSTGAVGAHLSGGLDSSSVVALTCRIGQQTPSTFRRFEVFSTVYPNEPNDESLYIDEMVRHWDLKSHRREPSYPDARYYATLSSRYRDFIDYPTMPSGDVLRGLAAARDIRVILTGYGGDECLTWTSSSFSNLVRQRQWNSLWQRLNVEFAEQGPWRLVRKLSKIPTLLRPPKETASGIQSLSSTFSKKIALRDRMKSPQHDEKFAHPSQEAMCHVLNAGWKAHGSEMEERAAARCGIEQRDPFLDRRIVEFALALPEQQRQRRREKKILLRTALADILPKVIATRHDKPCFDRCFFHAIAAIGGRERLCNLRSAEHGWVDADAVAIMYNETERAYDEKNVGLPSIFSLWAVIGIEFWLDSAR